MLTVHSEQELLLQVPDPEDVVERISGARLHKRGALVPWDLRTARRLTALKVPIISPIARDYDFPSYKRIVKEPMPHQIKVADFLVRNPRSFCLAEIGTGKTLSALWAADYLRSIGEVRKVLVVCPLTITNESWGDSIKTHFRHLSYTVLFGSAKKRAELAESNTFVHIINFEGVQTIMHELIRNDYDLVIIDESTAYKNPSTNRWKNLYKVIREDAALWMLTGTPTPQGPMDAYGQAKMMRVRGLPRTSTMYKLQTMYQVTQFKWLPREGSEQMIKEYLSPAIYVNKRDVLPDLPLVTSIFRHVEMSREQKRAFDRMRTDMMVQDADVKITAANAAVRLCKLLQIAAGVVYDDEGNPVSFDNKARINELLALIEQSSSKTVVYVPYLHVLSMVSKALEAAGYEHAVIYGDVPVKEREKIIKDFQTTENVKVLLAIPNAMAHGVTATAASTVVWFMPQPRHEIYTQACGRVDRIGQKLPVTVAHIFGPTEEKALYAAQQDAVDYERRVLSLYRKIIGEDND